jgi:hypothetical protein
MPYSTLRFENEASQMQTYRVRCRAKKEIKDPKAITVKNGEQPLREYALHVGQRHLESARAGD